jgi:hypothetical protein
MPKAEMYRDRARRLRVMAHEAEPQIHRELLDISEQYERLADQADMMARPPMWKMDSANTASGSDANFDQADATRPNRRVNSR